MIMYSENLTVMILGCLIFQTNIFPTLCSSQVMVLDEKGKCKKKAAYYGYHVVVRSMYLLLLNGILLQKLSDFFSLQSIPVLFLFVSF